MHRSLLTLSGMLVSSAVAQAQVTATAVTSSAWSTAANMMNQTVPTGTVVSSGLTLQDVDGPTAASLEYSVTNAPNGSIITLAGSATTPPDAFVVTHTASFDGGVDVMLSAPSSQQFDVTVDVLARARAATPPLQRLISEA